MEKIKKRYRIMRRAMGKELREHQEFFYRLFHTESFGRSGHGAAGL